MKEFFDFGKYKFINYTSLSPEQSELILKERNNDNVRKWMNNPSLIEPQDHENFRNSLTRSRNKFYWMVIRGGIPVGGISIVDIDENRFAGTWGFFLFEKFQGAGWGIDIEFYALYIFFNELNLQKVVGYVNKNNRNSIAIQPIFNFENINETNDQLIFELSIENYKKLPKEILKFKLEKILQNGKN